MSALTSTQRQAVRLQHEGIVINVAGSCGVEGAAETAFCMIDGQVSGLLRLIGPEKTAEFLFPLLDRVVRDVRGMTRMPVALTKFDPEPGAVPEPTGEVKIAPTRAPRPEAWRYTLYVILPLATYLAGYIARSLAGQ